MGLDININTDNDGEVMGEDYYEPEHDYFHKHGLSRTFCNLMCRRGVVSGEPELDQIARIASIDVSPICQMENYGSDEELDDTLNSATYFANFRADVGDGYIGNNFGQDLRNFRRFLEFAKDRGAKTVYFSYG